MKVIFIHKKMIFHYVDAKIAVSKDFYTINKEKMDYK